MQLGCLEEGSLASVPTTLCTCGHCCVHTDQGCFAVMLLVAVSPGPQPGRAHQAHRAGSCVQQHVDPCASLSADGCWPNPPP